MFTLTNPNVVNCKKTYKSFSHYNYNVETDVKDPP